MFFSSVLQSIKKNKKIKKLSKNKKRELIKRALSKSAGSCDNNLDGKKKIHTIVLLSYLQKVGQNKNHLCTLVLIQNYGPTLLLPIPPLRHLRRKNPNNLEFLRRFHTADECQQLKNSYDIHQSKNHHRQRSVEIFC